LLLTLHSLLALCYSPCIRFSRFVPVTFIAGAYNDQACSIIRGATLSPVYAASPTIGCPVRWDPTDKCDGGRDPTDKCNGDGI
jgi:hypothetical protein